MQDICAPLWWYEAPDDAPVHSDISPLEKKLCQLEMERDLLIQDLAPIQHEEVEKIISRLMVLNKKIELLQEELLDISISYDGNFDEVEYKEVG